jgi:acyl-CoA synthetase (AMP-forming)/AMP-acid ligase II
MHQVIARRAAAHAKLLAERPLRLIRSSSAPLPPTVADELELAFGAPVIESYGMTEAAHQIASNPLPPQARKTGTVGRSAGAEIRILDRNGDVSVEPGINGPVVIRGPALTAGYEAAPAANRESFRDGWFQTDDEGRLDAEGYLTLTGRLKEIINRGGEKISPREVDEALLSHPEVHQAVAFRVPHRLLGEDVAAAVVIHNESQLTASELRKFASQLLAPFKVPKRIIVVDEIPTGPSGKLRRMDLTERFGIDSD